MDDRESRRALGALAALNEIVLDTMPDGVLIVDRDGERLYANRAAVEMFDGPGDAGLALLDAGTGQPLPPDRSPVTRLLAGENLVDVVLARDTPDGARTWLSVSGRPVFDGEGHVWAAFAVFRDVTATRRAEQELALTADRFRVALAGSRVIVYGQDTGLRYTWIHDPMDPGTERALGRTDEDFLTPADAAYMRAIKQRVLDTGEPFSGTVSIDLRGTRRSFDVRFERQCSRSGHLVGLTGAAIDVTERERDLERLAAAQAEAEAANRAKDDFVALVSHELRNPVTPIRLWTRMLRRLRQDEGQFEHVLCSIERNTDTLVRLIDDLLDASRVVTGKLRLELRPVELRALLASVVEGFHPALAARRLELRTRFPDTTVVVLGDHARLQQVAWNLLSNAIKFTPPAGTIEIALGESGGTVEFSVADTGQGIPADLLPRIFKRYEQGRTAAAALGLGLGLSISHNIVEVHGGSIEAESAGPGQGARFTVRLPASAERPAVPLFEARDVPDLLDAAARARMVDGRSVLIAGAGPAAAAALEILLTNCGADVRAVEREDEIGPLLRGWRAHLALVDAASQPDGGQRLLAAWREAGGGPAIAITADSEPARARALALGFHRTASLPVDPAALVTAIAALASGEPSGSGSAAGQHTA